MAGPLVATHIYFTAGVLQEVADMVYGTEQTVAFASSRPAGPAMGRSWSGPARWAQETVASGAIGEPQVRTELTRRPAVGMLECFPLMGHRELRSLSMAAQSCRYRIARAFFDDHAQLPVTVRMPHALRTPPPS